MKKLLFVALLATALPASGQAVLNCVSSCCKFGTDVFLGPILPTQCTLYNALAPLVTTPLVAQACSFTRCFPEGANVSLTATATYPDGPGGQPPGGESDVSNTLAFKSSAALPDTTPPSAPGALTATVASATAINLAWGAATDNVGVTGYRLERCQGAGCSGFAQVGAPTVPSLADSGLTGSTPYSYRVRATDAAGNLGPYSNTASATTSPQTSFTLGETAVLTAADNGNANLLLAQGPYTLASAATIQSLSFYVTAAAGNLRLGIYDASGPGGGPGALKAQTASFVPAVGWASAPVLSPVSLPAGSYWLAYLPSSNGLAFRKATTTGVSGRLYTFIFGAMPATFSTSPSTTPSHWSFYATFGSSGGPPPPWPTPTNLRLVP